MLVLVLLLCVCVLCFVFVVCRAFCFCCVVVARGVVCGFVLLHCVRVGVGWCL